MPKKAYNNYYFFMLEKKNEYAKKGLKYTMKQMSELVSPQWKAMTKEDRAKYDLMAKEFKDGGQNIDAFGGKLASDGIRIADILGEERTRERAKQLQLIEIRTYLDATLDDVEEFRKNVPGIKFYIMEFNFACKIEETDTFVPIEIGLVEYSIQNGISKSYHKVIDFGPPPIGYFGFCKAHSDSYHHLFLNTSVSKENNYKKIWNDVIQFLSSDESYIPPIFTSHENFEVNQTAGCLKWLAKKSGNEKLCETINIWDLANLLSEIRSAVGHPIPITISIDLLKGSSFDYTIGINCDFHDEEDSIYCALGLAKRKCYLLSDIVCKLFNVTLTSNHIPYRALTSKDYYVYESENLSKSRFAKPKRPRVPDKISLEKSNASLDDLDNFDNEDADNDPPQPNLSRGIGRANLMMASRLAESRDNGLPTLSQLNQQFANVGLGRGCGRPRPPLQ